MGVSASRPSRRPLTEPLKRGGHHRYFGYPIGTIVPLARAVSAARRRIRRARGAPASQQPGRRHVFHDLRPHTAAAIERLSAAASRALQEPSLRDRLLNEGQFAIGSSPGEYAAFLDREMDRWRPLLQRMNIKVD